MLYQPNFSGAMQNLYWSTERLANLNEKLDNRSPRAVLAWAFETFGEDIVMATGFGPSGVLLTQLVSEQRLDPTIFISIQTCYSRKRMRYAISCRRASALPSSKFGQI